MVRHTMATRRTLRARCREAAGAASVRDAVASPDPVPAVRRTRTPSLPDTRHRPVATATAANGRLEPKDALASRRLWRLRRSDLDFSVAGMKASCGRAVVGQSILLLEFNH